MSACLRASDMVLSLVVRCADAAGAVALVVMLTSSVIEVVGRKLGSPTLWSADATVFSLLVLTFLCIAAVERRGEHMNADFFIVGRGPRMRRAAEAVARTASLLFVLLLVWQGWRLAAESFALGRTTLGQIHVPSFLIELLLPIGALLLALEQVRGLALFSRGRPTRPVATTSEVSGEFS